MAISRLTGMIIQTRGDDVKVRSILDGGTGKYAMGIELWTNGEYDYLLLDTLPATFETEAEALKCGNDLVAEIRAMPDLSKPAVEILEGKRP